MSLNYLGGISAAVLIALCGCSSSDSPAEGTSDGGHTGATATDGASGGSPSARGGSESRATGGADATGGTGATSAGTSANGGTSPRASGGETSPAGSGGDATTGGDPGSDGGALGEGGADAPGRDCLGRDIDIIAPKVTGKVTVNGVAIEDDDEHEAFLFLRGAAGDAADLGQVSGNTFSTSIASGRYDVFYALIAGTDLPVNRAAKVKSSLVVDDSPVSLEIDVPATTVSGSVTVNGSPITDEDYSFGDLELRNADGDRARISGTFGAAYSAKVAPGTYELYYHALDKARAVIPSNVAGKLQSGIVIGDSPVTLDIDVPATRVSVSVTVAGEPVSDVTQTTTFLTLKNDAGDEAKLTVTSESGASTSLVIPGTYDLYYSAYGTGPDVPKNSSVPLRRGIVVDGSALSLTVDVPATVVSGRATVNGAALSALAGQPALALQRDGGDKIEISPDATGAFRAVVVPGTYDLVFNQGNAGEGVPRNVGTKLQRGVVIGDSPVTLDIDIPVSTVSGAVTLNGETVTVTSLDDAGFLFLVDADGGQAGLSVLSDGSFSVSVIRGSYDLYYGSFGRAPEQPINGKAKLEEGIVVGDAPLERDWDVEAVLVTGTVVVNGAAVPDFTAGSGEVFLDGPDGPTGPLAFTSSASTDPNDLATGAYRAWVIPGSYELYYRVYNGRGRVVPANTRAHLGCFEVKR